MTEASSQDHEITDWPACIVREARTWLGTPYLHQASVRGAGCDCLGLVRGVWRALYGTEPEPVPHYTADWGHADGDELLLDAALRHFVPASSPLIQAGDLLVFRWLADGPAKHIGIVTTPETMIHAHAGACVSEVPFGVWSRKIAARFTFSEPVSS